MLICIFVKAILLFFSILLFTNSYSKPPLKKLKHLIRSNQPYESSIWRGVIAVESGLIKNIWLYANPLHSTTQLVKRLFHVEIDNELLATTYQPYAKFTSQTIILLLQALKNGSLYIVNDSYQYKYPYIKIISGTFKGNKSPKRLMELIELIKNAQEEEEIYYPMSTTIQLLLGLFYLRSNHIEELQSLLAQKESANSFNYTMDQTIIPIIKQLYYKPPYPPKAIWTRGVSYKNYSPISDCVETALRNVINELIYDWVKQQFSLDRLFPEATQAVKEFYSRNSSATHNKINHPNTHRDWLICVSNIKNCIYRKDGFELHPSVYNFFSTLYTLCGMNMVKTDDFIVLIKRWCTECSKNPFIEISLLKMETPSDGNNDISFLIEAKKDFTIKRPISIHIRPDHAWMTQDAPIDNTITAQSVIQNFSDYDKALMSIMPQVFEKEPPFSEQNNLFFSLSAHT